MKPAKTIVVEKVVQYRTTDNTLHDTYHAAVKHEHGMEFARWLEAWLDEYSYRDCPSATALAMAIKERYIITKRKEKVK